MRAILDTHVFLWWIANDKRLSKASRQVIERAGTEIFFSAASAWEIAVKCKLGKLELPTSPETFVSSQLAKNNFSSLPITISHALRVYTLEGSHRDPFDLMLIAQSAVERMPIITADPQFEQFAIEIIW
ncbi:MAG: PIN domain nuclease [Cyanobacteria bacterium DS2.3.42]|nr:PIN domain nuclease [Cyanobacteria bacterium DS2.3.42]